MLNQIENSDKSLDFWNKLSLSFTKIQSGSNEEIELNRVKPDTFIFHNTHINTFDSLRYIMVRDLDKLFQQREKLYENAQTFLNMKKFDDQLIQSCAECHLRPKRHYKKKYLKCELCVYDRTLADYGKCIYANFEEVQQVMRRKPVEEEKDEEEANKENHFRQVQIRNESDTEKMIKCLWSYIKNDDSMQIFLII